MGQPIYDKPPLPLAEQAGRLIERGLKGATDGELADFLATVSYYRLRGYTYRYQLPDKTFRPGAEWGTIREDYFFDSRLRELLFAAVSHVEIPLRTQIVLHMSLAHGPWWWSDAGLARDAGSWEKSKDKLLAEWRASRELFAKCHRRKYGDDALPPAWKVFETATFGILTRYYGNVMPNDPAAKSVAAFWGLQPVVLFSWLLHLNTVRNL